MTSHESLLQEKAGVGRTSQKARDRLVEELRAMGITSQQVLDAMATVPRHMFVPEAIRARAFDNNALPIGHGQTISQPYMVARMTELLLAGRDRVSRVLEIGTGCGYQSAVLSHVTQQVFSMERIAALLEKAQAVFRKLELHNIHSRYGDGYRGWLSHAPYDGILVAAAPAEVPQDLCRQLSIGSHMIIPIGDHGRQELLQISRVGEQEWNEQFVEQVSFVPLQHGLS